MLAVSTRSRRQAWARLTDAVRARPARVRSHGARGGTGQAHRSGRFTITKLAAAPQGATNCDDLTSLDGHLFTGCQNKALSNGGVGNSTLLKFGLDGGLVKTWLLKDKIDGTGADPLHHRVIITLDEDAHSHLATLTPSSGQITNYSYSPTRGEPRHRSHCAPAAALTTSASTAPGTS